MAKPGMTGGLFAPTPNKAESKAKTTENIYRSIVTAEAASREAKTERLRLLRMKAEADAPPPEPKKKAVRGKAAKAK